MRRFGELFVTSFAHLPFLSSSFLFSEELETRLPVCFFLIENIGSFCASVMDFRLVVFLFFRMSLVSFLLLHHSLL